MAEPVKIDGILVELSSAQQKKWDTGDETLRESVREKIRGYREQDGPQYDPSDPQPDAVSYNERFGES